MNTHHDFHLFAIYLAVNIIFIMFLANLNQTYFLKKNMKLENLFLEKSYPHLKKELTTWSLPNVGKMT